MALAQQLSAGQCLLEWHPYTYDRTMGLNHQLASLSCFLSEAYYLGRTAVLNDRMCLFKLHTERWPGNAAAGDDCMPLGDIFDIGLLSSIVPVELRAPGRNHSHPMLKGAMVQVRCPRYRRLATSSHLCIHIRYCRIHSGLSPSTWSAATHRCCRLVTRKCI